MTVLSLPITDEASWLAARQPNINASEVAALFGCHAQETKLSLYARKAGLVAIAAPEGKILDRGHILEPAVVEYVRREHRPDWRFEKNDDYLHYDQATETSTRVCAEADELLKRGPR